MPPSIETKLEQRIARCRGDAAFARKAAEDKAITRVFRRWLLQIAQSWDRLADVAQSDLDKINRNALALW